MNINGTLYSLLGKCENDQLLSLIYNTNKNNDMHELEAKVRITISKRKQGDLTNITIKVAGSKVHSYL